MAILPRNANEKIHVVRFEFVRWQIIIERFLGLEPFVALVAFCNQSVGVIFSPHRRLRDRQSTTHTSLKMRKR